MILERVEETPTKKKEKNLDLSSYNPREVSYALGKKLYQGCDTCKTETRHYLINNDVTCVICGRTYQVKEKQEPKPTVKLPEVLDLVLPKKTPKFIFI